MNDEGQDMWKSQPTADLEPLSAEELRLKAAAFQRRISGRNRREFIAGAIVIVVFLLYAWMLPHWVTKLGALLTVGGVAVALWQLERRASAGVPPAQLGASLIAFHRAALTRQRDALRLAWLWYVGPLIPGAVVFEIGRYLTTGVWRPWISGAIFGVFVLVALLNLLAARAVQKRIDELDELTTGDP